MTSMIAFKENVSNQVLVLFFFALSRRTHVETLAMQATSMSNQCHRLVTDYNEFSMTNQLIAQ